MKITATSLFEKLNLAISLINEVNDSLEHKIYIDELEDYMLEFQTEVPVDGELVGTNVVLDKRHSSVKNGLKRSMWYSEFRPDEDEFILFCGRGKCDNIEAIKLRDKIDEHYKENGKIEDRYYTGVGKELTDIKNIQISCECEENKGRIKSDAELFRIAMRDVYIDDLVLHRYAYDRKDWRLRTELDHTKNELTLIIARERLFNLYNNLKQKQL